MTELICTHCDAGRPAKYGTGECAACYKRRWRRENPEAAARDRAISKRWKDANRDHNRARDRAHHIETLVECPAGCGSRVEPGTEMCRACRRAAADERRITIIGMYEAGLSLREIAERIGTSVNSINTELVRLRKSGVVGRRRNQRAEECS